MLDEGEVGGDGFCSIDQHRGGGAVWIGDAIAGPRNELIVLRRRGGDRLGRSLRESSRTTASDHSESMLDEGEVRGHGFRCIDEDCRGSTVWIGDAIAGPGNELVVYCGGCSDGSFGKSRVPASATRGSAPGGRDGELVLDADLIKSGVVCGGRGPAGDNKPDERRGAHADGLRHAEGGPIHTIG